MVVGVLARHEGRMPNKIAPDIPYCYLYICAFADRAKVGVTRSPSRRFPALRAQAGEISSLHIALLRDTDASRREGAIALAFGFPTGTKGRNSEWFDLGCLEEALEMARVPQPLGRRYERRQAARASKQAA